MKTKLSFWCLVALLPQILLVSCRSMSEYEYSNYSNEGKVSHLSIADA